MSNKKKETKEVQLPPPGDVAPQPRKVICKVLMPELTNALIQYLRTRPHAEVDGLIQSLSRSHEGEFTLGPAPGPESQGS